MRTFCRILCQTSGHTRVDVNTSDYLADSSAAVSMLYAHCAHVNSHDGEGGAPLNLSSSGPSPLPASCGRLAPSAGSRGDVSPRAVCPGGPWAHGRRDSEQRGDDEARRRDLMSAAGGRGSCQASFQTMFATRPIILSTGIEMKVSEDQRTRRVEHDVDPRVLGCHGSEAAMTARRTTTLNVRDSLAKAITSVEDDESSVEPSDLSCSYQRRLPQPSNAYFEKVNTAVIDARGNDSSMSQRCCSCDLLKLRSGEMHEHRSVTTGNAKNRVGKSHGNGIERRGKSGDNSMSSIPYHHIASIHHSPPSKSTAGTSLEQVPKDSRESFYFEQPRQLDLCNKIRSDIITNESPHDPNLEMIHHHRSYVSQPVKNALHNSPNFSEQQELDHSQSSQSCFTRCSGPFPFSRAAQTVARRGDTAFVNKMSNSESESGCLLSADAQRPKNAGFV